MNNYKIQNRRYSPWSCKPDKPQRRGGKKSGSWERKEKGEDRHPAWVDTALSINIDNKPECSKTNWRG